MSAKKTPANIIRVSLSKSGIDLKFSVLLALTIFLIRLNAFPCILFSKISLKLLFRFVVKIPETESRDQWNIQSICVFPRSKKKIFWI